MVKAAQKQSIEILRKTQLLLEFPGTKWRVMAGVVQELLFDVIVSNDMLDTIGVKICYDTHTVEHPMYLFKIPFICEVQELGELPGVVTKNLMIKPNSRAILIVKTNGVKLNGLYASEPLKRFRERVIVDLFCDYA